MVLRCLIFGLIEGFEEVGVDFEGGGLAEDIDFEDEFGGIFFGEDDAFHADEWSGGDAAAVSLFEIGMGVEAGAFREGLVDLGDFFDEGVLVDDFDDLGDAIGGEGFIAGVLIAVEKDIAAEEGQEGFEFSAFADGEFFAEGQEVGDVGLEEIPGEGLFVAGFGVGDPP